MGLHSTYIKRQESILNQHKPPPIPQKPQDPCDESFISLPADYTSLGSDYTNEITLTKPIPAIRHLSVSQNSLADISLIENELKKMRHLSKSQDDLTSPVNITQRDIQNFRRNPEIYQKGKPPQMEKDESSDEEYCTSVQDDFKSYDTISSQSCCSITTEANCDFEFFGKNDGTGVNDDNYIMRLTPKNSAKQAPVMRSFKPFAPKSPKARVMNDRDFSRNFKITRSNSKRSLDKLDSYIRNSARGERASRFDSFNEKKIERTNSNRSQDTYVVRSKRNNLQTSFPDISRQGYLNLKNLNASCIHFGESDRQKKTQPVLSVESLCSILNHKGISYLDNGDICNHNYGGSVPDFKKIFVSDYI